MTKGTPTHKGNPTIVDVAERAKVSKSTVSNVVRGSDRVAAATIARVQLAIAELGYKPNGLARQFVQQRTTMLGVLTGDLANPFYGELSKRVERCAFERGYTAMFSNIEDSDARALTRIRAMTEHRVAGIIFLALFTASESIRAEIGDDVPVVFAGMRERWGSSASTNETAGGRIATEHLLELGHERIAFLTSPHIERRAARERHAGYQGAIRAAGLEPRRLIHWDAGSEMAVVDRQPKALFDEIRGEYGATAVFCANDLAAIALLDYCDRHAIKVPGELSIVGFDDVNLAELERISLTTIRQPLDLMAEAAVETVISGAEGHTDTTTHRVFEPSLIVRSSTGPIKPSRKQPLEPKKA